MMLLRDFDCENIKIVRYLKQILQAEVQLCSFKLGMIKLRLNYFTQEPSYDHYLNIMIMKLQSFIAVLLLIGLASSQWISEQKPQRNELVIHAQPSVVIIDEPNVITEPAHEQKIQPKVYLIEEKAEEKQDDQEFLIPEGPINPFDERYRNQDKSKYREQRMNPKQHRKRGGHKKMRTVDYKKSDEVYMRGNEQNEMGFPMDKICMGLIGLAGLILIIRFSMKRTCEGSYNRRRRAQIPQVINQNPVHIVNQQSDIDEAIFYHKNELKRLKKLNQNNHHRIQSFEQEY